MRHFVQLKILTDNAGANNERHGNSLWTEAEKERTVEGGERSKAGAEDHRKTKWKKKAPMWRRRSKR